MTRNLNINNIHLNNYFEQVIVLNIVSLEI